MIGWLLSPNIWLAAGIVAFGGFAAVYHTTKVDRAYERGIDAGKGATTTETLAAAKATRDAQEQAEAETTLPADKAEIIERCKRAASCRDRGNLK